MRQQNRKSSRAYAAILFPVIGLAILPMYRYGRPWINFHQRNFVVYDFRINSETAPVGSNDDGFILELLVSTGQRVQAGDIVAKLCTSQLEIEREKLCEAIGRHRAVLAAQQNAIDCLLQSQRAKQTHLESQVRVTHSELEAVESEQKWIEKEANNMRKLQKRGTTSRAELDSILRELDRFKAKKKIASAQLRAAQCNVTVLDAEILETRGKRSRLKVIEKEIEIAKAELHLIEDRIRKATIRAQCSGTITRILRGPDHPFVSALQS